MQKKITIKDIKQQCHKTQINLGNLAFEMDSKHFYLVIDEFIILKHLIGNFEKETKGNQL